MAVLDHSHSHGYIRAVLCRNCNAMEGKILNLANRAKRDKSILDWLKRLIEYEVYHAEPRSKFMHHLHKTEVEKKAAVLKRRRIKRAGVAARNILLGRHDGDDGQATPS